MDEVEIVRRVVGKLRERREVLGISQAELSRRTGLSRSGIRHMEDGDVTPTLHFLLCVARELDVGVGGVISEIENAE